MKRWLFTLIAVLLTSSAYAQTWPDPNAYWSIRPHKTAGMEMTDPVWAHLHLNSPDATSVTIETTIDHLTMTPFTNYAGAQFQLRYTVHGIPVSGWLNTPPFTFTLNFSNSAMGSITDGVHDLSVEIQGLTGAGSSTPADPPVKQDFKPYPMYLHIGGRSTPSTLAPVIAQNLEDALIDASNGTGNYIDAATLTPTAHPADSSVVPWTGVPPYSQDLYLEQMQPHSREFTGIQMLWEEPPGTVNQGLKFLRALEPKLTSNFLEMWDNGGQVATNAFGYSGHRSLPVKDGARGIGWTNGYVQGVVEPTTGILWMVNISGQLRIMKPDGELITVVGWRVRPDKQPIWRLKPMTSIRQNMEFIGSFVSGGWPDVIDPGWHEPMDVALDPNDNTKVYVAAYYDNAIYRVDVNRTTWVGTVTLIAGDVNHQGGYVNATGDQARFNGPVSLIASNDGTKLYVSDMDNDAIRIVTLSSGAVTTAYGHPNLSTTLQSVGSTCSVDKRLVCYPASEVRTHLHVTVSSGEASGGIRPDIYAPFFIRISSTGDLVLFDRGMNTLRRINPSTHVTTIIDTLGDGGFGNYSRDWVWGDVDKTGNSGVVDGVYWGNIVSISPPPGSEVEDRFNENYRFAKIDGTSRSWVFGSSRQYHPEDVGPVATASPPHYPWLIAIDPRGAVIVGGIGDHGLVRLRKRRPTDPTIPDDLNHLDARRVWESGAPSPLGFYYTITNNVTNSVVDPPSLLYGYGGHNMIGMADTWSITPSTSDGDIDTMFNLSSAITSNASAHAAVLAFLRQHSEGATPIPPPPDTTAPTVSVTAPVAGVVSGTVTVTASASDNVGVVGVQFLLDSLALQSEDTSSPYTISWDTTAAVPNGAHTLKARARDLAGNVTTSAGVAVTVTNTVTDTTAPAVSVTAPTGTIAGVQTVTATATDNVAVAGVQFRVDGLNLGAEDTSSPYSVSWDTRATPDGSYTLTAIARDAAGNTTVSADDIVTVDNPVADTTPPAVSITAPSGTVSGTVSVTATATDAVGVVGVQFKLDGQLLGSEDLAAAYSVSWITVGTTNGSHTLTAVARDAAGNVTTSADEVVTVSNAAPDTTPPTVSVTTSPATVSGTISLAATASDAVGVVGVQFKLDGGALGTEDLTSTYGISWDTTTATNGAHTITATARDAAGNVTTSAGVAFTVNNVIVIPPPTDTTPPSVHFTAPADGATVAFGTTTVTASASDNVSVASVQFFVDGDPIAPPDIASPYSVAWTNTEGSHSLTVRALDPTGNIGSTGITVIVAEPPVAGTMTMVPSATTVTRGQTYTLTIDVDPRTVHLVRLNNQRLFTGHDCTPTACHKVVTRKANRAGTITETLTGEKDDLSQWPPVVVTITVLNPLPPPKP